ncbi:peptidoglycan-binding domain-containing protein [Streptomyces abikoensis]|uniref:peptidoglycan-binding domain-containing protein n=1 Tax=Streptomyces abikoensis TaxID=97398 RepID=UPI0033DBE3D0
MPLDSARFAGVDRLERCLAGEFAARLDQGTTGDFVALVQQALMDLGQSLPAFGADGVYGEETVAAVLSYKTAHDLRNPDGSIDGVVGPLTMAALDQECTALDETFGECPPDSDGPVVDLGGADEQLVNVVLAHTAAAVAVGVDGDGATRLVNSGAEVPTDLAAGLVSAAARMLGDDGAAASVDLVNALGGLATLFTDAGEVDTAKAVTDGAQWPPTVDPGPALAALIAEELAQHIIGGATLVRDHSKDSALIEAVQHADLGRISLKPAPTTAPDGSIQMPDAHAKFTIPSTVAGVEFKVTQGGDKRLPSYHPVSTELAGLDIRHVVGLVRLALHLSSTWGVTEVHHAGIGDPSRNDCHGNGRAIDFVGVVGSRLGAPFHLTVFNDWKNHSVPDLDDPAKPRRPDWPPVTRRLEFRLLSLPGVDPLARDFFADLYAWVAGEYQDMTDGPRQIDPPSAIGKASRIMTPDHPTSAPGERNGREAHHSHMHWQVGPTGAQAP